MTASTRDSSVVQRIVELKEQTRLSWKLIADTLNEELELGEVDQLTKDAARGLYRRHYRRQLLESAIDSGIVQTTAELFDDEGEPNEVFTDNYRKYFGDGWEYTKEVARNEVETTRYIVAVGDLHGKPDRQVLYEICGFDPDIIVIGGDTFNSEQATAHKDLNKSDMVRGIQKDELPSNRAWLQFLLDNTTAHIYIMDGNHDKWLWRLLTDLLPEWAVEFFQDPLDMLLHNLPKDRVERVKTSFDIHYPSGDIEKFSETAFLFPLGDCLFSHMNFSGKHAGDGVKRLGEWIDQWHMVLGLPDFSLLVQFHGHKIAMIEDKGGYRTMVEPGMGGSLSVETYKTIYQPKWRPGNLGFVAFEQVLVNDEWRTDTSSITLARPRRRIEDVITEES